MARRRVDVPWPRPALNMDSQTRKGGPASEYFARGSRPSRRTRPRLLLRFGLPSLVLLALLSAISLWLGNRAATVKTELQAAVALVPQLKQEMSSSDAKAAAATVGVLRRHTSTARGAADDPAWTLAAGLPWIGPNFSAIAEVTRSADDVTSLGLAPLVTAYGSLNWDDLLPSGSGANMDALKEAAPRVVSSAYAVRASSEKLEGIDTSQLLPQVAGPVLEARNELKQAAGTLSSAADAASIAPAMLGADSPQNYLLVIQNNAETRASGGIPGALAILTFDRGKLALSAQSSAGDVGVMSPALPVDPQQQQIYSTRLGKYMQDVNMTPDWPTAASTAQAMWEKKTGQRVDGVLSLDPVVLSYILQATGPVALNGPELSSVKAAGLPTELTGNNVVRTLLSEVYAKIQEPKLQDAYFAGVAKEVFAALSNGKGEAKGVVVGITRGAEEGRVLAWSADAAKQALIAKYQVSGSISGPSVPPAQFGIYFNDGTGAKMDYYMKRTVQLVIECPAGGYEETTIRITSTNTAPADASRSLPEYVTGGGAFGVAPGTVQTNIIAYGPVQANIESAVVDGQKMPFAPYVHANRPVGLLAQQLAPGESKTVDFTFGKIVQHTEPNVVVTPTVQPVKDVIQPTESASCDQTQ